MSVELEPLPALPLAQIQEAAATLILHAARQVSPIQVRDALANLGLESDFRAFAAMRRVIKDAVVGVEVQGNPMSFFDDPSLPEEVRYR